MEGKREETSKLAGDSGSRRSIFMVRQFIVAMIAREDGKVGVGRDSGCRQEHCCGSGNVPLGFNSLGIVLKQLSYASHSIIMNFPYTYISCPCTDISAPTDGNREVQEGEEEREPTFDPRSPRANFSLYPLEHLLYCEDCQQIRCPRCIIEEIVCWYCPSCLFEMPLSVVKSEGPR